MKLKLKETISNNLSFSNIYSWYSEHYKRISDVLGHNGRIAWFVV
jgi:membrane-bound lytic murein transglycosylase